MCALKTFAACVQTCQIATGLLDSRFASLDLRPPLVYMPTRVCHAAQQAQGPWPPPFDCSDVERSALARLRATTQVGQSANQVTSQDFDNGPTQCRKCQEKSARRFHYTKQSLKDSRPGVDGGTPPVCAIRSHTWWFKELRRFACACSLQLLTLQGTSSKMACVRWYFWLPSPRVIIVMSRRDQSPCSS